MEMPTATACVLCDHTPCVLGGADKTMWLCVPCDADVNDRLRLRETKPKFDEAEIICECYTCGVGMTCADVDDIPPEAFHEDCPECEACRIKEEATANCRCDACGDCTDISNKCLHEKPCHCDHEEEEEPIRPPRVPYEDDKYKWNYDDCGILCRYDKEAEEWEVMEPQCVDCGHKPEECDCDEAE